MMEKQQENPSEVTAVATVNALRLNGCSVTPHRGNNYTTKAHNHQYAFSPFSQTRTFGVSGSFVCGETVYECVLVLNFELVVGQPGNPEVEYFCYNINRLIWNWTELLNFLTLSSFVINHYW